MKNKIVLLLIIVSLLSIVIIFSIPKNKIEHKKHSESISTKENKAEIKGVWITYMDLSKREFSNLFYDNNHTYILMGRNLDFFLEFL